jgi:hypothetical protein
MPKYLNLIYLHHSIIGPFMHTKTTQNSGEWPMFCPPLLGFGVLLAIPFEHFVGHPSNGISE